MDWHVKTSIDRPRILTNNGTESRSGRTEIQQNCKNVSLVLVLLFIRTEVECRKGLLHGFLVKKTTLVKIVPNRSLRYRYMILLLCIIVDITTLHVSKNVQKFKIFQKNLDIFQCRRQQSVRGRV